jgi:hypothetical protein
MARLPETTGSRPARSSLIRLTCRLMLQSALTEGRLTSDPTNTGVETNFNDRWMISGVGTITPTASPTMRFFTRQWLFGELSDEEYDAVPNDYCRHVGSLQLPPDVMVLSQANLHDARILDVCEEPDASRLTLRLRCGDLQRGYSNIGIVYATVRIDTVTHAQLHRARELPPDEMLYDEVDRAGERFEHRLIFASKAEVSISFGSVAVSVQAVDGRLST